MSADDPLLTAYALGELHDPAARAQVEKALQADPALAAQVAEIRATAVLLDAAFAAEPTPQAAPVPFPAPAPAWRRSLARWSLAAGIAAGLSLAFLGVLHWSSRARPVAQVQAQADPASPATAATKAPGLTVETASDGGALPTNSEAEIEAQHAAQEAERLEAERLAREARQRANDAANDAGINGVAKAAPQGTSAPQAPITVNDTPTANAEEPESYALSDDQIIELDPVEVSSQADYGYGKTNSSAYRITNSIPESRIAGSSSPRAKKGLTSSIEAARLRRTSPALAEGLATQFKTVVQSPTSTFGVDVDTASYALVRSALASKRLPDTTEVRTEELLNAFRYDDPASQNPNQPLNLRLEAAPAPWAPQHTLLRVSLAGYELPWEQRPTSNLVFLVDVSGSMNAANKLPLVQRSLNLLLERLDRRDRVAIITYASESRLVLPPTTADNRETIAHAIDSLTAAGSTNGEGGIRLAYNLARERFLKEGNNRVILCTDGDFNVGVTDTEELVALIEKQAKSGVYLSVFGYGMGNYRDGTLEQLADKGNGNYGYIDNEAEARKRFVAGAAGTLLTIADNVKLQLEFNPAVVRAWRLIGYENRTLAREDFRNDAKDAGEIGSGHRVTALYELVPTTVAEDGAAPRPLKYQDEPRTEPLRPSEAWLTAALRYRNRATEKLDEFDRELRQADLHDSWKAASADFRWSAAVAAFGERLRHPLTASFSWSDITALARSAAEAGDPAERREFLRLINEARRLDVRGG